MTGVSVHEKAVLDRFGMSGARNAADLACIGFYNIRRVAQVPLWPRVPPAPLGQASGHRAKRRKDREKTGLPQTPAGKKCPAADGFVREKSGKTAFHEHAPGWRRAAPPGVSPHGCHPGDPPLRRSRVARAPQGVPAVQRGARETPLSPAQRGRGAPLAAGERVGSDGRRAPSPRARAGSVAGIPPG